MKTLVGYTGFVGSNLYENGTFDEVYNSKNIREGYGTRPDLLVYAGVRAEKYLANHEPEKDLLQIKMAKENIEKINPRKLVLISTIDVFKNPNGVDEDSEIDIQGLHAYGLNRYWLECQIREQFPDCLIIRLPGLFGKNIKKNFIYDYIHKIPFMLNAEKYMEIVHKKAAIGEYYTKQENGFYRVCVTEEKKNLLKELFEEVGFSALNFTDSRSVYQFYNLERLWRDLNVALENEVKLWHAATEPVSAGELYRFLAGEKFENELNGRPVLYDFRSKYANIYNGENGYICNKQQVMKEVKKFVDNAEKKGKDN